MQVRLERVQVDFLPRLWEGMRRFADTSPELEKTIEVDGK
jgi:hypothetical protein